MKVAWSDIFLFAGGALVVVGIGFWSIAAAIVTAGVELVALAYLLEKNDGTTGPDSSGETQS